MKKNPCFELSGGFSFLEKGSLSHFCKSIFTKRLILRKATKFDKYQLFSDRCSTCNNLKDTKKKLKYLKIRSVYVDDEQNAVINAEQFHVVEYRDNMELLLVLHITMMILLP